MSRDRGFTLIELLVVVCVVALLFGVALERLLKYQELAERTAMELNLSAINVALNLKFAALVTSGRSELIEKEAGANPTNLLARPPENYLGELYAPAAAGLPKASWHYDLHSHEFVYVPNRARYLSFPQGTGAGNLRFRIVLTEASKEPGAPREIRQPYIASVAPYLWVFD
jgi:prepilin-type N-terminal cleavage/methylation domain-containing protein